MPGRRGGGRDKGLPFGPAGACGPAISASPSCSRSLFLRSFVHCIILLAAVAAATPYFPHAVRKGP
eukprot:6908162-Pyramimonas_sp.AAC.1